MATEEMSDLAGLSAEELEAELATLASHLYAAMCRWLELVGELDRRGRWEEWGCGSCAEWLAWRCALLPRTAREHVRVARRLPELPLVRACFARGELSYAKVRALTRVADADSEGELLELAQVLTAAQLERAVRAYRRVTTEDANNLHADAYVSTFWDDDGSLMIQGRLAPEDGALLLRALEAARDSLWQRRRGKERGSAEPRPTSAEVLAAVADASLASHHRPPGSGDRYQVVVHVDLDALACDADAACALADGAALAPETTRRLACDGSVVAVSERNGRTVRIGRKTRTVPPALRRALRARDRGCRFPGCENHRFVDAHHVRHWSRGGETRLDNLVLLCRRHHRLVHEGGYGIDDKLRFYDPWGRRIPRVWQPPPGDAKELVEDRRTATIGPSACASGTAEPMDLALTVDAILSATGKQGSSTRPWAADLGLAARVVGGTRLNPWRHAGLCDTSRPPPPGAADAPKGV